jgi:hypothetical protein
MSTECLVVFPDGIGVLDDPTLTPVLPEQSKAIVAAVIVAPGGAFLMLSMDNEGFAAAHWLADHGVAAFVLKYRLKESERDPNAYLMSLKNGISIRRELDFWAFLMGPY